MIFRFLHDVRQLLFDWVLALSGHLDFDQVSESGSYMSRNTEPRSANQYIYASYRPPLVQYF